MNIKWKIITSVMLLIVSIACVLIGTFLQYSKENIEQNIELRIDNIQATVTVIDRYHRSKYRNRIKSFINYKTSLSREGLLKAFEAMDREELFQRASPFLKLFKKENPYFTALAWLSPDNHNFLRVHNPKKHGDDISTMRPDIVTANHTKKQNDGYVVSGTGVMYSIVQPVSYNNKHLGIVQFALKGEFLLDAVQQNLQAPVGLLISNDKYQFVTRPLLPTLPGGSHTIQSQNISFFEKLSVQIDWTLARQKVHIQEKTYVVVKALDLLNYNGQIQGNVVVALDISQQLAETHTRIVFIIALSCFLVIGSFLILYFSLGYLLKKITKLNYTLKQNNKQLQEHSAELQQERDLFMQGPVMTFTWQNSANWPVKQVSKNVLDILGYSAEEFLDGSVLYTFLIHPDDLQRVVDEIGNNSGPESSSFIHKPYRLLHRNGKAVWILDSTTLIRDNQGDISHYSGYLVDISASKLMEKEILETKDRLELVIEGARLGTWDWNIKTGEVIFNKRWAEILGYGLEEIRPHISTWKKIVHPDEQHDISLIMNEHLEGRIPVYMVEHRLRHKSGKWVWVLDVGKVFERDKDGNPLRVVGIHFDISEQKEASLQLIEAKETAESANHAKSVFLSNMSHELRTPLNAILGFTQIFAGDSSLTSQQQKGIKSIHESGEHLLMLINDILDLSKIEAGKMELVPTELWLPEFLREIADIIGVRAAEKKIQFLYEPEESLPVAIEADELRLRQILLNLLSNAIKFTTHGQCSLRVHSTLLDAKRVLLSILIEDSGAGIAPEMLEKIFEPFQQTGDRLLYSEGSGLGLAISRKLVNLMGGELQVVSPTSENPVANEGPGSRFSFSIQVLVLDETPGFDLPEKRATSDTVAGDTFAPATVLVAPSQGILEELDQLVKLGDIDAVVTHAADIAVMESGKFQLFAEQLKQMAETFQLTELENFISMYIDD